MEIIPAPGWEELREDLERSGGVSLLLGATDAGKSTLARYLVAGLAAAGRSVALIDADVGQSALCLPGTVGMKLFRSPTEVAGYRCERFVFLGSATPVRIATHLVEAAARFTRQARREADAVIIDTTGLITGDIGLGLKLAKIRATEADLVVAVQREGECEPILGRLAGPNVMRLLPSPLARGRSQEARARRRGERLSAYFAGAGPEFLIRSGEAEFLHFFRSVNLTHPALREGTVVGLNRGEETLALGLVTEVDRESVTLRSPVASVRGIDRVVFGDIALE